jgi:hypothetical protein
MFRKTKNTDLFYFKKYSPPDPFPKIKKFKMFP